MIYGNLKGRLGNQMFIWAFAYALSRDNNNEEICIIPGRDGLRLSNYDLPNTRIGGGYNRNFIQKVFSKFYAEAEKMLSRNALFQYEKFTGLIYRRLGMHYCQNGFFPGIKQRSGGYSDIVLNGYFQSEKYFGEYSSEIKTIFRNPSNMSEHAKSILETVSQCPDSVCLGIRLGDYISNPLHGVCNIDYYKKAVKLMKQKLGNPVFWVFSDDPELARLKLKEFDCDIRIESGNWEDYEKLKIMSECQHFIISNSSFEWWAQYLGNETDKIVIAPSRWFAQPCPCNIQLESWHTVL